MRPAADPNIVLAIAVHDYAKLSHEIVEGIACDRLTDLERFADVAAALTASD
jgi:uncharacterized protein YutE (UPF0331/DUF86 family)